MAHEKTISDLAYHLWQARGCPDGSSEIDWTEAERQVRGNTTTSAERASDAPITAVEPDIGSPLPKPVTAAEGSVPRTRKKAKR